MGKCLIRVLTPSSVSYCTRQGGSKIRRNVHSQGIRSISILLELFSQDIRYHEYSPGGPSGALVCKFTTATRPYLPRGVLATLATGD